MGKLKGAWKVASAGLTGVAAGAGYRTSRNRGNSVGRSAAAGTALGAAGAGFKWTKKGAAIGAATFTGGSESYNYLALHSKPNVKVGQHQLQTRRSNHSGIDNKTQQHWNG